MADKELPAPTNSLTTLVNSIVDQLVLGVGEQVVIAQAKVLLPWLNIPIISWMFTKIVSKLAKALDLGLKNNIDILIIRAQNDYRRVEYEKAILKLKESTATAVNKEDHEKALAAAKAAMDKLIFRSK